MKNSGISLRSWSSFLTNLTPPTEDNVARRITTNFNYYKLNYFMIYFVLTLLLIVSRPALLLAFLFSTSLFLFFFILKKGKLTINDTTLKERELLIVVIVVHVALVSIMGGMYSFVALIFTLMMSVLHSIIRTPKLGAKVQSFKSRIN
ncbi:prenylated rab acceptor 1-related [Anaeramoeba flamelloides]|uniref:PRA1 family protein n=1 Tax=Anaeramoeba flamelloides TaxID=1746091 RepID=A0AAV7Z776_9EUKA|nr:prenylated rab acceptor 1-related [Anaeramoeba flamelloides]